MRTVTTLKPGQKGIEELLTRFGPSLLCVRDRHDEVRREHLEDRGVDRPGLLSGKRSRLPSIAGSSVICVGDHPVDSLG